MVPHGDDTRWDVSCPSNTFNRLCRPSVAGQSFELFQNSYRVSTVATIDGRSPPPPCYRAQNGCTILIGGCRHLSPLLNAPLGADDRRSPLNVSNRRETTHRCLYQISVSVSLASVLSDRKCTLQGC